MGVIPVDWKAKSLDSIAAVTSGKRLPLGYLVGEKVTPYPYIRVTDMRPGGLVTEDIKYVPVEAYPAISRYRIFKEDLFISVAGSLGIVGKIPVKLDGANLTENANRISEIKCDRDYLLYVLMSPVVQDVINSTQTIGAQPKLALTRIRNFVIPLPPTLDEQHAITTALSDMDALLDGLDRLIAKKRAIKQATMQQLLTGQTRLPGFSGEWEVKRLGELGIFLKGTGIRKDEAQSGVLPCVRYGELYTHHDDIIRLFNSYISREVAESAIRIKKGDILFAGSGETKEEIGKCAAFVDEIEAYAGGDVVILRPIGVNSVFMGYCCNTPAVTRQKSSLGQGDAVVHISANALSSIEVYLPDTSEQTAIATILSDMDAEITTLEIRRTKTSALKQAMMQELLTGRTRLV
ncbi:restriction endonuclease subunit S [Plasticicumulans lactativorans]|uniref:restriction endonuclease subunit S n=1 Tax=Plasticicumulans lactativorans TaxID=1133106 RepID=UPI00140493D2|nr:restriction endonuclease subunit S [Plasticicumulans lactativorans]